MDPQRAGSLHQDRVLLDAHSRLTLQQLLSSEGAQANAYADLMRAVDAKCAELRAFLVSICRTVE